jgi:hypothetical protein
MAAANRAVGICACGAVRIEIDMPAFWAWHDHSKASRLAQGCAYATYIGCWKSRVHIVKGKKSIRRFEEKATCAVRCFCAACGTPLLYERAHAPKMVNVPRALFAARTGREPLYHLHMDEAPEWTWRGEALSPLKGYPGVLRQRSKRRAKEVYPFGA